MFKGMTTTTEKRYCAVPFLPHAKMEPGQYPILATVRMFAEWRKTDSGKLRMNWHSSSAGERTQTYFVMLLPDGWQYIPARLLYEALPDAEDKPLVLVVNDLHSKPQGRDNPKFGLLAAYSDDVITPLGDPKLPDGHTFRPLIDPDGRILVLVEERVENYSWKG